MCAAILSFLGERQNKNAMDYLLFSPLPYTQVFLFTCILRDKIVIFVCCFAQ